MLIMRFNRTGKKNRVSYRIVLQEHTAAPGKRHVEILGSHDPHSKTTVLKEERIKYWLGEGVQTSDAVHNLLVAQGLVTGEKRAKKMPRPESKEQSAEVASEEAPTKENVEEGTAVEAEALPEEAPAPEVEPESVPEPQEGLDDEKKSE